MATRSEQATGPPVRAGRRPEVLLELGWVAVALVCYLVVRWFTLDRTDQAIANARRLLDLERRLSIDWEHPVQDATLSVPGFDTFFTQFYVWGYFPALIGVTIWLYVRHRDAYRTVRNALLASGVVGLLVYAAFPCAPPWIGGAGFTDTVSNGAFTSVARPPGFTNHLAAVPSFHVGWVILVAVVVLRVARTRLLRVLCVLHPAVMAYAVVATGNHWVLDIPAGAALAAVGLIAARVISRIIARITESRYVSDHIAEVKNRPDPGPDARALSTRRVGSHSFYRP